MRSPRTLILAATAAALLLAAGPARAAGPAVEVGLAARLPALTTPIREF